MRKPRHAMIGARRKGKGQDAGDRIRVFIKRLPEVTDAKQKNNAGVLRLQGGALLENAGLHYAVMPCAALSPAALRGFPWGQLLSIKHTSRFEKVKLRTYAKFVV